MMDTSGDNPDHLAEEDPLGVVRKRKLSNRAEDCGAVMVETSNIQFLVFNATYNLKVQRHLKKKEEDSFVMDSSTIVVS